MDKKQELTEDDVKALREALAGDLAAREWRYTGCNTVDGLYPAGEWWEVCHPMPLDGTAQFIGAASPSRIARVLDEMDRLRERVAELERDAARGQFARKRSPLRLVRLAWRESPEALKHEEPDAAVDAAIAAQAATPGAQA